MLNTTERKILALAARVKDDPEVRARMRDLISPGVDMGRLTEIAAREGLATMLFKSLKNSGVLETLKEKETLQQQYYHAVRFNLNLIHDLKEVLQHCSKRNIRPLLLQGIDLILDLYQDIGLRPMTDMDLWVVPEDYPAFVRVMVELGYERDPVYPNTFRRNLTTVDLHTHLLWADRIRARQYLLKRTEEEILKRARTVTLEGEEALRLSPYDQVIYLTLHGMKHRFQRLIWLSDIINITSNWSPSNWQTLRRFAIDLGQEKAIEYLLFLLFRIFGYPHGAGFGVEKAPRLGLLEKRALMERVRGDSLPFWAPLLLLSSEKDLRKRIFFSLETLFPRPEVLRQVFPSSHSSRPWQLYLKRVIQLLGMVWASLRVS